MIPVFKFIEDYWNYYLLLEKKFLDTLSYVELHEDNFDTFSNEYANQIYSIGAELDSLFKVFCHFKENDYKTFKDYGKYIMQNYPEILTFKVKIKEKKMLLSPFNYDKNKINNSKTLFWWQAYDNLKHSRHLNKQDGNLKNTLYILSALYLLEMFYMKKKLVTVSYVPINDSKLFTLIESDRDLFNVDRNFKIVTQN